MDRDRSIDLDISTYNDISNSKLDEQKNHMIQHPSLVDSSEIDRRAPILSPRSRKDYTRLKYYSALKTGYQHLNKEEFLNVPKHVIDDKLFLQDITFNAEQTDKHGSFTTIFSVWNSMVGTGLIAIPWAYNESGLMLGLLITFVLFVISFYTCYLVLKVAGNDVDYTDTLKKHFGRKGWMFGMVVFIGNLCIPIIIYFQLLAQNLYPILLAMTGSNRPIDLAIDFSEFSYSYTCFIILVMLFGVTAIRNVSIFVKVASFGVIFVSMIIIFIVCVGIYSFTNTDFVFKSEQHQTDPSSVYIKMFNSNFGPLMGILGGGYYLHNITLPIVRNSRNPEKNVRDVFIGYFLVFMSYSICGVFGAFGFQGSYFLDHGYTKFLSNCLLMFDPTNVIAIIMRLCVFCQLLASMSLIFACQRNQIFLLIYGNQEQRPLKQTLITNTIILIIPFILAVFYPDVGTLAAYLSSVAGLFCIYVLPTVTYLKSLYTQIKNPILIEAIREGKYSFKMPSSADDSTQIPASPKIQINEKFLQERLANGAHKLTTESERKKNFQYTISKYKIDGLYDFQMHLLVGVVIMSVGGFAVIAQYF